jgi:hypothetical protein
MRAAVLTALNTPPMVREFNEPAWEAQRHSPHGKIIVTAGR